MPPLTLQDRFNLLAQEVATAATRVKTTITLPQQFFQELQHVLQAYRQYSDRYVAVQDDAALQGVIEVFHDDPPDVLAVEELDLHIETLPARGCRRALRHRDLFVLEGNLLELRTALDATNPITREYVACCTRTTT